jgi:hypothetical protein
MGLDIYLYRAELPFSEIEPIEQEYRDYIDLLWSDDKPYDDYTEEEKEEIRAKDKAKAAELGLGEYGEHPARVKIELDSPTHPDSLFKIGYFRSSYNESGMENVFEQIGVPGLHEIFANEDHEYEFTPDWSASLERAKAALEKLKAIDASGEAVGATHVHGFREVNSAEEAIAIFNDQRAKHPKKEDGESDGWDFRSFSCYDGVFWLDGFEILGAMSGRYFGSNGTWVIFKRTLSWYVEYLEVVVETIEYVLDNPLPEGQFYYFHWSG